MGSNVSKNAGKAIGTAGKRTYPVRPPPTSTSQKSSVPSPPAPDSDIVAGPTVHSQVAARETKDQAISLDARDPHFAASLRSLGPVQPNSTMSNTSTFHPQQSSSSPLPGSGQAQDRLPYQTANIFPDPKQNPALEVLEARTRILEEAEKEHARARVGEDTGRRFLDIGLIRQILVMRDRKGMKPSDIDRDLGLNRGIVDSLSSVGEARVGKTTADDAGLYG